MLFGYTTWSPVSMHAGKIIRSCLSPHWCLFFLSAQCSNISCLANNRTRSCLSGSFNTLTVNHNSKWTRGTNLGCEKGAIEKRRLLSRLGSVYILFWCKIRENAVLITASSPISAHWQCIHTHCYLLLHSPKNMLTHRKVQSHHEKASNNCAREDGEKKVFFIFVVWVLLLGPFSSTTYYVLHQINL